MMKVFYKWLYTKIKNAGREVENQPLNSSETITRDHSVRSIDSTIESNGMNFTVYRANGGHVIDYRSYDKKLDRNNTGLYIITDGKDLGEEIGRIITIETLRG